MARNQLPTVAALAQSLAEGRTTSRALVEEAIGRIEDAGGEGRLVFTKVHAQAARSAAEASDRLRKQGVVPSPLAGLPVSIKDLYDIAGDPTPSASKLLKDAEPAKADAAAVARLRAAGAVVVGRTNMTEFAFSGIGLNPHYGTPANPWDRKTRRVPGGSSSGAAVSVTDRMAVMGLGSDTGGSVRIPAALCGIAGFKPTQRRVPLEGAFPLSPTLDSVGPLAPSLACCVTAFQVLAGEPTRPLKPAELPRLKLGVPQNVVLDALDQEVANAFESALAKIRSSGTRLVELKVAELDEIGTVNRKGGIPPPEAWALHRRWAERSSEYDARVWDRIVRAKDMSAADYIETLRERERLIRGFNRARYDVDAFVMPTVPKLAPPIAELERDADAFRRVNALMLRNTSLFNFLDGCGATLPIQPQDAGPVGLMVAGFSGEDERVLGIGLALEAVL